MGSIQPQYKITHVAHKKVELRCSFQENITWTFNGGKLPSNAAVRYVNSSGLNILVITYIQRSNAGKYQCISTGYLHIKEDESQLVVIEGLQCSIHKEI